MARPQPQVAEFLRLLDKVDRSRRQADVFRDFCTMSWCALSKRVAAGADEADRLEEDYMRIVRSYQDPDAIRIMPELLAIAALALARGGSDFFGLVAAEIGTLDGRLGQFFTPYDTSRMIARMTLQGIGEKIAERGYFTLMEPAAGVGGMLVAAADVVEEMGYDPATTMWFEAVELNNSTAQMLYIQTCLRGLSGMVFHGNSLTLETFRATPTQAAFRFLDLHGNPRMSQDVPMDKAGPVGERMAAE